MSTSPVSWEAPAADHPARQLAIRSMTAVATGDKDGWLALFAPDAVVEDPVGPSLLDPKGTGHRGHDAIAAFWDGNFGQARQLRFRVTDSFANGASCADVASITVTLHSRATLVIDCVIVYTVNAEGQITSLRAHWEPDRAMATLHAP